MSIDRDDPRLTAYALGELSGAQFDEVRREVEASGDLQQEVEQIGRAADALALELAIEPAPPALAKTEVIASAKAASGAVKPAKRRGWVRWSFAAASALAAICIVAVTLNVTSFHSPKGEPSPRMLAVAQSPQHRHSTPPSTQPPTGGKAVYETYYNTHGTLAYGDGSTLDSGVVIAANGFQACGDPGNSGTVAYGDGGWAKYGVHKELRPRHWTVNDPATVSGTVDASEFNTESYDHFVPNPFVLVAQEPLSTFAIDVDTASYANVRRFLNANRLPPKGAVRAEEMINYFHYNYPQPEGKEQPFAAGIELADCPWQREHKLVRIGIKGREVAAEKRPPSNLVFLLDVSGSMGEPNKLPFVKEAMKMLVARLNENDRVAIVVYADSVRLHMPSTRCDRKELIVAAIDALQAGGCTNGAGGIEAAYKVASDADNFIKGGVNRVILCTDGDFNVGVTDQSRLVDLIQQRPRAACR